MKSVEGFIRVPNNSLRRSGRIVNVARLGLRVRVEGLGFRFGRR